MNGPPLAFPAISPVSIGIAGVCVMWILLDIVQRRGWKSLTAIGSAQPLSTCLDSSINYYPLLRISVYVINALQLWPMTVRTYLKYERPSMPRAGKTPPSHCAHSPSHASAGGEFERVRSTRLEKIYNVILETPRKGDQSLPNETYMTAMRQKAIGHHKKEGYRHVTSGKLMFVTTTVAVCHRGAGCVLRNINGRMLSVASLMRE